MDDTISTGSPSFALLERETASRFECKPKSEIFPLLLGGVLTSADVSSSDSTSGMFTIYQFQYKSGIQKLDLHVHAPETFANARAKLPYVVFSSRLDFAFDVSQLSQINADCVTKKDITKLNNVVDEIQENVPLTYRHLDKESISVVGYADAGFSNNADHTS